MKSLYRMQPITINPADVASLLLGLKPFNAMGPDDIPATY